MFSSAKDEHKHDRSQDNQIEDQVGDQAFVKQEQRCVHHVFDIFDIYHSSFYCCPKNFEQRRRKFNGVKSYAKLIIQKQKKQEKFFLLVTI
jgi:hypothetical protein